MALASKNNKRPVKTVSRANSKSSKDTKTNSNKEISNKQEQKTEGSQEDYGLKEEIVVLIAFACAAILVLSNFELAGSVGRAIKWLMFGFIGVMEYFFPFVVAGTIIFISVNRNFIKVARIKAIAVYGLMVDLAAMWQRITNIPRVEGNIFSFFTVCANEKRGGGFFGGLLCKILYPLGTVGSFVIMLVLMIICIVVITEKSFIRGIKKAQHKSKELIEVAKNDYNVYKEQNRLDNLDDEDELELDGIEENGQINNTTDKNSIEINRHALDKKNKKTSPVRRMGRKVLGVTSDTLIEKNGQVDDDIDIENIKAISDMEDEYSKDIYEPDSNNQIFNGFNEVYDENKSQGTYDVASDDDFVSAYDDNPVGTNSYATEYNRDDDYTTFSKKETANAAEMLENNASGIRESLTDSYGQAAVKETPFEKNKTKKYQKPDINCLKKSKKTAVLGSSTGKNDETARILKQTLLNFGVAVDVVGISYGPSVTRYEIQPEQGVKVSKIVSLADDIKLSLAAADIRIEAPIPGKSAIGIEVPNKEATTVGLRELIESKEFKNSKSKLVFAAGRDIAGKVILADIAKMPHMLIAGATGSGKSVCINTIITSILYNASPEEVRMILVDPKVVELSVYNGIPHLAEKVVTDPKEAAKALNWAVIEMDRRYKDFAKYGVRNLEGYNEKIEKGEIVNDEGEVLKDKKPQILIIIDELADLMMVSANEVEDAICRLAQLARAAGIHMVIATQRPSVNVVTGLIKANVPSRIAFAVSSGVDSRTILDMNGAEKLLGKGDMLYFPSNLPKPVRVQGAFISDDEVADMVEDVKRKNPPVVYDESISKTEIGAALVGQSNQADERDSLFAEAGRFVIDNEKGSIGMLQRHFKIGFNRAGRIMDQLFEAGVVGQEMGTKPRKVEMSKADFEQMLTSKPGESA